MDIELQRKLDRIKNHATRYELAMTRGNERLLVCYTARRGRRGIFEALLIHVTAMVWRTGVSDVTFADTASGGATMGEWHINFTGRTQRQAYIEGALEHCQHNMPLPVAR